MCSKFRILILACWFFLFFFILVISISMYFSSVANLELFDEFQVWLSVFRRYQPDLEPHVW